MPITYTETDRYPTQLADETPCDIVTYDTYEDENLIAEADRESQIEINGTYHCWQISNPSLVITETKPQYMTPNSNGAVPSPKGTKNPGGSPVKY